MNRLQHLIDRGLVSFATIQPHERVKDDGGSWAGSVNAGHIDDPAHQRAGSRGFGKPSKGGGAGAEWSPGSQHIANPRLGRAAYPGHRMSSKGKRRVGVKGGIIGSGPMYGSRGRSRTSY
jgi:hypothetical protein